MHATRMRGLLVPLFALLGTCFALGAVAATAEQQLRQQQQEIEAIETQRQLLRSKLNELQNKMAVASDKDIPEKAALEAAQALFEQTSEDFEREPTSEHEAKFYNAEFKLHLAERRYRKANSELDALETEYESIKAELSELRQAQADAAAKIEQQKSAIASEKQRRQNAELARAKAESEAAKRELERLRAELEERERAPAAAAAKPAPKPAAKVQVASRSPAAAAPALTKASTKASNEPMELDDNFFLLTSASQVAAEKERLEKLLGNRGVKVRTNKILNIRQFVDGSEAERSSHRFRGLGNYQYRAEAPLAAGESRLRVQFDRWNIKLDPAHGGQDFVFLMDASDRDNPRLVAYPAKLD